MPLIPQQNIIVIDNSGGTVEKAVAKLYKELEVYPAVRIVSISITFTSLAMGVQLVAVVETV
ncbi:hypothetical protein [Salinibacterium sp. ZJ450]|uniref:hypothetical protein n=1 Tax=Salinibacterium sp. ZJ450 TaxID=2708338 RepID=UPI00141F76F1|nr:hypothetical protein [Salinibacterium sp. ZJ450]